MAYNLIDHPNRQPPPQERKIKKSGYTKTQYTEKIKTKR